MLMFELHELEKEKQFLIRILYNVIDSQAKERRCQNALMYKDPANTTYYLGLRRLRAYH